MQHRIRGYEVDANQRTTIVTIANLLQVVLHTHASVRTCTHTHTHTHTHKHTHAHTHTHTHTRTHTQHTHKHTHTHTHTHMLTCSHKHTDIHTCLNTHMLTRIHKCSHTLIQEIAGNHAVGMWGRTDTGFANLPSVKDLIFVMSRLQIQMHQYPRW